MKRTDDNEFMMLAIQAAKESWTAGNRTPFGAVIVKNGKLITSAHNTVKNDVDSTAHAEINVIRKACKILNSNDLSGCSLYTTCEPCPMCFSAAWWSKINKIVYGLGINDLMEKGNRQINVSCYYLNEKGNSRIELVGGVMKKECLKLLDYF